MKEVFPIPLYLVIGIVIIIVMTNCFCVGIILLKSNYVKKSYAARVNFSNFAISNILVGFLIIVSLLISSNCNWENFVSSLVTLKIIPYVISHLIVALPLFVLAIFGDILRDLPQYGTHEQSGKAILPPEFRGGDKLNSQMYMILDDDDHYGNISWNRGTKISTAVSRSSTCSLWFVSLIVVIIGYFHPVSAVVVFMSSVTFYIIFQIWCGILVFRRKKKQSGPQGKSVNS